MRRCWRRYLLVCLVLLGVKHRKLETSEGQMAWHELFIDVRSGYFAQAGAELYNKYLWWESR